MWQYAASPNKKLSNTSMKSWLNWGEKNKWDKITTLQKLKGYYDGYHFSGENMTDIFNPYSLICALAQKRIKNFWVASGATTLLSKFVDNIELRIKNFEKCYIDRDILETSDVTGGGAELFLYQSGYLTIKAEDEWSYTLGFPNYEVRKALYSMALPAGGLTAAKQQIITNNYTAPFQAENKKVVALAIEIDEMGKGIIDWSEVE